MQRFIEFTTVILFINLALALFAQVGLANALQMGENITSTSEVIEGGSVTNNNNKSIAYKIDTWYDQRQYIGQGIQSDSAQYLQAGGDFVQAWKIFSEVFLGAFILEPTLRAFGVPQDLVWYFSIPYMLLYVIAVVGFFSGRALEPK